MQLTVKSLLSAYGLNTPPDRIKLVRHTPHLGRSIRAVLADGVFDRYQAEQSPEVRPFDDCDVIVSFIGIEGRLAELVGVYLVHGSRPFEPGDFDGVPDYLKEAHKDGKPRIWYDLEELEDFRPLRGRLIAQWKSARGWFQGRDLEVYELLPPGEIVPFPGYQDVLLSWGELKAIFATPRAHRDWKVALSSSSGIYRIVDLASGKTYIGAAYGAEGIWGRWQTYSASGHGGNKYLRDLDPAQFRWSIIRTLSGSMSEKEVIRVERIEMEKHGSRAVGLNW